MCCFPHITKNGNLFFRRSQRPHTLEEKHDIWQEECFSYSGNPPQSAWLTDLSKISLVLTELHILVFQRSHLQWFCASLLGLTKVLLFSSFLPCPFGSCCWSGATHKNWSPKEGTGWRGREERRAVSRVTETEQWQRPWDKRGRLRWEAKDGDVAELTQDRDGAKVTQAGRKASEGLWPLCPQSMTNTRATR